MRSKGTRVSKGECNARGLAKIGTLQKHLIKPWTNLKKNGIRGRRVHLVLHMMIATDAARARIMYFTLILRKIGLRKSSTTRNLFTPSAVVRALKSRYVL